MKDDDIDLFMKGYYYEQNENTLDQLIKELRKKQVDFNEDRSNISGFEYLTQFHNDRTISTKLYLKLFELILHPEREYIIL